MVVTWLRRHEIRIVSAWTLHGMCVYQGAVTTVLGIGNGQERPSTREGNY
jgi:hypothetical protein